MGLFLRKSISLLVVAGMIFSDSLAIALPTGYTVESGQATFDTSDLNTLTITASDQAIINFDSFSIGANEAVRFIQNDAGHSVLGRVTGGSASDIYGSLFGNSSLFLVNPNGINFYAGSNVQAHNLIASTQDIQSSMFLARQYTFEKGVGSPIGRIFNEGMIAGSGIALLAEDIENRGVIQANLGSIVLGIGERQTLAFEPSGKINLVIDRGLSDTIGKSIQNSGTLQADGGLIVLSARSINQVMDSLINSTGLVQATRAVEREGKIVFESTGGVQAGGVIRASDVLIAPGTRLLGGAARFEIERDWDNRGVFQGQASTVEFVSGLNSRILGDNAFNRFVSTAAAKHLYFEAGKTQTIFGDWTIRGAYGQHVRLLSTEVGAQWLSNALGGIDISYAWVEDAVNLNGTDIVMTESTNRGNSVLWDPVGTWTNGGGDGLWSTAANWSGLGGATPGAGDDVVFDGTNTSASFVDPTFGGTIGSLDIGAAYGGTVTLQRPLAVVTAGGRSGDVSIDSSTLDLGGFALNVAGDFVNIGTFTMSNGLLVFDGAGTQQFNTGGASYDNITLSGAATVQLNGNELIVTDSLNISGVSTLSLGGENWTMTGATFDNNGTVRLRGSETITGLTQDTGSGTFEYVGTGLHIPIAMPSLDYFNLTINATDGLDTFTTSNNVHVYGALTVSSGTYDENGYGTTVDGAAAVSGGSYSAGGTFATPTFNSGLSVQMGSFSAGANDVDVNGNLTIGADGSFTAPSTTLYVSGGITFTGNAFSHNNGTVVLDGTDQSISGSITFNNLTKQNTTNDSVNDTLTLTSDETTFINGTLTLSGLDANDRVLIRATGASAATFSFSGPMSGFSSAGWLDVEYNNAVDGGMSGQIFPLNPSNSLDSGDTSGWFNPSTYDFSGSVFSDEGLTDLNSVTVSLLINGGSKQTTTVVGVNDFSFTGVTIASNDILTLYLDGQAENAVLVTVFGGSNLSALDLYQDRLIVRNDVSGSTTNANLSTASNGEDDITGIYSVGGGGLTLVAGKELLVSSTGTYAPGGDVTADFVDVRGNFTHASEAINVAQDYVQTGGTFSASLGVMDVGNDFTISGGTFNAPSTALYVAGDFTVSGGTYTHNSGTLIFDGTTTLTADSTVFGNVQIGTDSASGSVTLASNFDVDVLLDFNSTGGAAALDSTNRTVNYAGATLDLTNADTFTTTGSTWVFDNSTTLTSAGKVFNNVTLGTNSASGYLALGDATDINGLLTFNTTGGSADLNSTNRTVNYAGATLNLTNADTFTTTGSTWIFDGTTTLTSAGETFNNVTIGTDSDSGTLTLADTTDINGLLTFNTTGGIAALDSTNRTVNYAGATLNLTNADTFLTTGSTWIFDGTTSLTSAGESFNNVTIGTNTASGSLTLLDTTDFNGTLSFNTTGGTAAMDSTNRTINYAGATLDLTNADTFTTTGSTWIFDGTTSLTSAGESFNNVTIGTNTASGSLTLADTTDINGTLSFNTTGGTAALNSTNRIVRYAGNDLDLTNADTFTTTGSSWIFDGATDLTSAGKSFNNVTIGSNTASGTVTLQDAADINGTLSFNTTGGTTTLDSTNRTVNFAGSTMDLTDADFFTTTGSTWVFDGATLLTSAGKTFNNVTIGSNTASGGVQFADTTDINGTLSFNTTGGTTTLNTLNQTVNYAGAALNLASADTFNSTGSTWIFDGTTTLTSAGETFNNVTIGTNTASGSLTLADTTDINGTLSFNTTGGTAAMDSTNRTINYAGATLDLTNADTFTTTGSTWIFDGTTTLTSAGETFNNVTVNTAGTVTLGDALAVNGAMSVSSGTFNANGAANTVTGLAAVNGGVYTASTGTQTFDGGLTVSSGTFTAGAGTLDVNGVFTLSGGTFTAPSAGSSFTLADDFVMSGGTFNHNSGEAVFDTAATATIEAAAASDLAFFDLTIASTAGKIVQFTGGGGRSYSVANASTFDIGNNVTLTSSNATAWDLAIENSGGTTSGISFGTGVSVAYSNNTSVNEIDAFTTTDGGNNARWNFSAPQPPADPPANPPPAGCEELGTCGGDPPSNGDPPGGSEPPEESGGEPSAESGGNEPPNQPGGDPGPKLIDPLFDDKKSGPEKVSFIEVMEGAVYVIGIDGTKNMLYDGEKISVSARGAQILMRQIYVGTMDGILAVRGKTYEKMKEYKWGERPSAMAATRDGRNVYAISANRQSLVRMDARTFDSKDIRGLEQEGRFIALSRRGAKAYVLQTKSSGRDVDRVKVFDLKTDRVVDDFAVGSMPTQAVVGDGEIYVVEQLDKTVSRYDLQSLKKTGSVKTGLSPYGIVSSPDGQSLYVSDSGGDKVIVVDAREMRVAAEISVGSSPCALSLNPKDPSKLYVANRLGRSISIVDLKAGKESVVIRVGERPSDLMVLPEGDKLYVANELSNSLSVIDLAEGREIQEVPVGMAPNRLALSTPPSAQSPG